MLLGANITCSFAAAETTKTDCGCLQRLCLEGVLGLCVRRDTHLRHIHGPRAHALIEIRFIKCARIIGIYRLAANIKSKYLIARTEPR